jgi:hypothetical protein
MKEKGVHRYGNAGKSAWLRNRGYEGSGRRCERGNSSLQRLKNRQDSPCDHFECRRAHTNECAVEPSTSFLELHKVQGRWRQQERACVK